MAMTNAQRQAAYRERKRQGLEACRRPRDTAQPRATTIPAFVRALEILAEDTNAAQTSSGASEPGMDPA
jgi:hypothetical protein